MVLTLSACFSPAPPKPVPPPKPAPTTPSAQVPSAQAPTPPPAFAPAETPAKPKPPVLLAARSDRRNVTGWISPDEVKGPERVKKAEEARTGTVKKLFSDAGVTYPPAELLFRTFKKEKELEVWATSEKGGAMTRVATYEVCSMSGDLGPKRAEGDMQVPEGFYTIPYYWHLSNYHLEMNVGYPNASDKVLGSTQPGGAIMIHGSCASIGCIAMGDERVEELWVMTTAFHTPHSTERRVNVHIFPSRDMKALLEDKGLERHWGFWANLKEGLDRFEQSRRLPAVSVDWRGRYTFR
jgi:murein L,D-transpeptidase YafK